MLTVPTLVMNSQGTSPGKMFCFFSSHAVPSGLGSVDSLSPPLAFHTSEIWLNLKQEFKSSVPIVKKKGSMVWKLPGQAREGDLEWEVSHFKSASFLFIPHMLQSKKVKKNCTVQNFMVQYKEMYSWNLFWTCVLTIDSPYKMEITCGSEKPSHSLAHLGWMLLSQWSVWIHSTHRRPVSLEKKKLLGLKSSVDVP